MEENKQPENKKEVKNVELNGSKEVKNEPTREVKKNLNYEFNTINYSDEKTEKAETSKKTRRSKKSEESEEVLDESEKRYRRWKTVFDWVVCFAIALILAVLIRQFVGTPTIVKNVSMYPTLVSNERLILNRIPRTFGQMPKRGEIITFEEPSLIMTETVKAKYENKNRNLFEDFSYYVLEIGKRSFIKRVIAIEGDHVQLKDGKVYLNGEKLDEPYLQDDVVTEAKNSVLEDFTVPEGYIFAMGDNRDESTDCRSFGCIPKDKVEAIVWIRFWPFDKFGTVK